MESISVTKPIEEAAHVLRSQDSVPVQKQHEQKNADGPAPYENEEESGSRELGSETLEDVTRKMNTVAKVFNTSLSFTVDEPTGKTVITVKDKETEKVIRQIPPKHMLKMMSTMKDVMGLLLDVQG